MDLNGEGLFFVSFVFFGDSFSRSPLGVPQPVLVLTRRKKKKRRGLGRIYLLVGTIVGKRMVDMSSHQSIWTKSVDFVPIELQLANKVHFHLQGCGNRTWARGSNIG